MFSLYYRFWAMLRDRTPQGLLHWLEQDKHAALLELRTFAVGVSQICTLCTTASKNPGVKV